MLKHILEMLWGSEIGKKSCSCSNVDKLYGEPRRCDDCGDMTREYTTGYVSDRDCECASFLLCRNCRDRRFR